MNLVESRSENDVGLAEELKVTLWAQGSIHVS